MRYMKDVKDMLCEELEKIAQKGELTTGALDAVDKLTHSIKSIVTIMAMEDSGYSSDGSYRGSYRGQSEDGSYDGGSYESSYRRGRSMTTGRYISRASGRYSRDGMREKLEEMMENAPDDHTRQEIQRLIDKM